MGLVGNITGTVLSFIWPAYFHICLRGDKLSLSERRFDKFVSFPIYSKYSHFRQQHQKGHHGWDQHVRCWRTLQQRGIAPCHPDGQWRTLTRTSSEVNNEYKGGHPNSQHSSPLHPAALSSRPPPSRRHHHGNAIDAHGSSSRRRFPPKPNPAVSHEPMTK